ncbi:protein NO VEIN domain-containing protein [Chromobacterium violaceum]|uniref:protein NO VEIN domain-containing protein n=1 Tax=Chromobacterium violaceum TaxID=536 RepID=UPI0019523B80|nr:DUF3883 domain-containing protein [Chromobacterium violaceum]QRO34161.1 DUF3883 domain-containing protein [Chromobacterium violaceum]QRQ16036.1 DUF3883 domain-containing protein [Chromobacterium violaceum]
MKIWLIPASDDNSTINLSRSMENEIDVVIRQRMKEKGLHHKYAWGAKLGKNESNRRDFSKMRPGDICLFYTADQRSPDEPLKAYRWLAKIEETIDDLELGDAIWPPSINDPISFPLIYFITTPIKIFIPTAQLPAIISENKSDYSGAPKGFMSINEKNLAHVRETYKSGNGLIKYILSNFAQEDSTEDYPELFDSAENEDEQTVFTNDLLKIKKKSSNGKAKSTAQRRSKQSKVVGDIAELFVVRLLQEAKVPGITATDIKHVADQKLGWDIEYTNQHQERILVEVKGSTAPSFSNFEITANEHAALDFNKEKYHFYLVGSCMTNQKKVQIITDMAERLKMNTAATTPLTYRVELQE